MPYQQIPLGDHVRGAARAVVRAVVDPYLSDFHFLLTIQRPEQGPRGSLQPMLATVLLAATDGAAQLLHPGKMGDGSRFKEFLKENFPWGMDPPQGLTVEEACAFLWDDVRCPLLHRYAMRAKPLLALKVGRIFSTDDAAITTLESSLGERPYTMTSVRRNDERTVLWIEPFYWSLRVSIAQALSTKGKSDRVNNWITSGAWDRTLRASR